MKTNIDVVSRNELSKDRYVFKFHEGELFYYCYMRYERDSIDEPWGHDWPKPLSYEDWCSLEGLEDDYGYYLREHGWDYEAYRETMNPVCQRAANGKPKLRGSVGEIANIPRCPSWVALAALTKFRRDLTVRYK